MGVCACKTGRGRDELHGPGVGITVNIRYLCATFAINGFEERSESIRMYVYVYKFKKKKRY